MKLYEIPDAMRQVESRIAEADGELTPETEAELDALEMDFHRKAEYLGLLAREAKAEKEAYKIEADRLAARVKAASNRESGLKRYLQHCMESAGVPKIKGNLCTLALQKNGRPSIEWMGEPDAIPEGFKRVVVSLDGVAAYDAWRSVPEDQRDAALPEGFRVQVGQHLMIR